MSSRPRIIFLNRFYWPEEPATGQLLTDLAEALATGAEFDVHVLTSTPSSTLRPRAETHRGVAIRRIRTPRLGGRGAFNRLCDWLGFGVGALWRVWRDLRRGDILVLLTDPPLLAALAAPLAQARGARVIHYVQDIYPELPEVLNGTRGLGPLRALRNRAWRRAAACVVLGTDMAAFLRRQGVAPERIHVVPNWAPHGLAPAAASAISEIKQRWGVTGKFTVAYSGNLGRVHDLDPVITLAAALRENPAIVFLFIGDGAQRAALAAQVQSARLPNVHFLPHQPRAELAASLGAADVHLVTLRAGCEALVFPSKLYGIAAAGRPVLFIGPTTCELAQQVVDSRMGRAFSRTDITGLAQALITWQQHPQILAESAQHAARFAQANGGVARAAAAWSRLLTQTRL